MNALDILKNGHQTVLSSVEGLAERDWETPNVCGVWSVKEIIAHLASYEQMLVDVLRSLSGDDDTPTLDRYKLGIQQFNDYEVGQRQGRSVSEVLAEYEAAHAQAMTLLADIPVEGRRLNGTLPWYGEDYDLEDFLVYSFYGHKREHCAQIAVFRDQLVGLAAPVA